MSKIREIFGTDKLILTRDLYHQEKLIPAGTIFYSLEPSGRPAKPTVISGYGANLQIGISVTTTEPRNMPRTARNSDPPVQVLYIPLGYLQLVEK